MHRERDLLHNVIGLINRDIYDTGYECVLRDLRYGIDTTDLEEINLIEQRILSECFEVINECELFILLIGERYGSVFNDQIIPRFYLPNHNLSGKSVTHLEIDYGTQQLKKENILVFERQFSGDLTNLPSRYFENEIGLEKNKNLKKYLSDNNYQITTYSANIQNNKLAIDEYVFTKHAQGYIENMVLNYIDNQNKLSNAQNCNSQKATKKNTFNNSLKEVIFKKLNNYPTFLREVSEKLILLRIQRLLCESDFKEISNLGDDNNAIQSYRELLINNLPSDFLGLLQEICKCISNIIDPTFDTFYLLQILVHAQKAGLDLIGGVSFNELMMFFNNQNTNINTNAYDSWLSSREEHSGLFSQQLSGQRALSYFLEAKIITYSDKGYLIENEYVTTFLFRAMKFEINKNILEYTSKIFWFSPDPIHIFDNHLKANRYNTLINCLKNIRLDTRFKDKLLHYAQTNYKASDFINLLEKFLNWMVHNKIEEIYIQFVLQLFQEYIDLITPEEKLEEIYLERVFPLFKKLYSNYYNKNKSNLTLAKKCFLFNLLEEIESYGFELDTSTKIIQMAECQKLLEAVSDFRLFNSNGDSEEQDLVKEAKRTLINYISQWEQIIQILQFTIVQDNDSHVELCNNLFEMYSRDNILDKEKFEKTIEAIMLIHPRDEICLYTIITISNIAEQCYKSNNHEIVIRLIHLLYDLASKEEFLRCAFWLQWYYYISPDLILNLYENNWDEIIDEIKDAHDQIFSQNFSLEEVDKEISAKQ